MELNSKCNTEKKRPSRVVPKFKNASKSYQQVSEWMEENTNAIRKAPVLRLQREQNWDCQIYLIWAQTQLREERRR